MSVERLLKEFKAQDVGAHLVVHYLGVHTKVADWVDGNKKWVMNEAGAKFLANVDEEKEEAAEPKVEKPAKAKKEKSDLPDLDAE